MKRQKSLSKYLKSLGVKSVADLARFGNVHRNSLHYWHNNTNDRKQLLVPLIDRYLESKKDEA